MKARIVLSCLLALTISACSEDTNETVPDGASADGIGTSPSYDDDPIGVKAAPLTIEDVIASDVGINDESYEAVALELDVEVADELRIDCTRWDRVYYVCTLPNSLPTLCSYLVCGCRQIEHSWPPICEGDFKVDEGVVK